MKKTAEKDDRVPLPGHRCVDDGREASGYV